MRHPFHAICPYFAMFPESFVERQVLAFTQPGDVTFDPFCGRGTTVFQSLLMGRRSAGTDVNPVAVCIAGAKAVPPSFEGLINRIDELEREFEYTQKLEEPGLTAFFRACFAKGTLEQILYIRKKLDWRHSDVDRFIAAMSLGALHGESHRSKLYFSNRMPRTISTKPDYSMRWWNERNYIAPERDVFSILKQLARFRFRMPLAPMRGSIIQSDARKASEAHVDLAGSVKLVVTSPPYLDTTDYSEDQWLRLWFLGGEPFPELRKGKDDRITAVATYWRFLTEAWGGLEALLAESCTLVIRIGGKGLSRDDLYEGISASLESGIPGYSAEALDRGITTLIKPRETTAFRPGQPSTSRVEHDFTFRLTRTDA